MANIGLGLMQFLQQGERPADKLASPGSFADRLRRHRKATESGNLRKRGEIFKKKRNKEVLDVLEKGSQ